jgi:hypothetical protein
MDRGFFLKLLIGILAGFGLLMAGFCVYEPVWFKIQEWRLQSDDPATVESAASAIAEKGIRAIPQIRKWLKSPYDRSVIRSCKVLEKMSGDLWQEALPDLENILEGAPSIKTDAAAALLFVKNSACEINDGFGNFVFWKDKYYSNYPIRRNICLYVLNNSKDENWRSTVAVFLRNSINDFSIVQPLFNVLVNDSDPFVRSEIAETLGLIGDTRAVIPLINTLNTDPDSMVREAAAESIGRIGDMRAMDHLICAAEKDKDNDTRQASVWALCFLNNVDAVPPIVKIMLNESDNDVRWMAIQALGRMGDLRAVEPLLSILENETDIEIIKVTARSLGLIGDKRAVPLLLSALEHMNDNDAVAIISFALSSFAEDEKVVAALEKASERNKHAIIGLAWEFGGKYLEEAKINQGGYCSDLLPYVCARWGDYESLDYVYHYLDHAPENIIYKYKIINDLISRMPDEFPPYDCNANWATRVKQSGAIYDWKYKNLSRLAWDAEKRKYYLKPEGGEK